MNKNCNTADLEVHSNHESEEEELLLSSEEESLLSSEEEELTAGNGHYREQLENEVEDIIMDVFGNLEDPKHCHMRY